MHGLLPHYQPPGNLGCRKESKKSFSFTVYPTTLRTLLHTMTCQLLEKCIVHEQPVGSCHNACEAKRDELPWLASLSRPWVCQRQIAKQHSSVIPHRIMDCSRQCSLSRQCNSPVKLAFKYTKAVLFFLLKQTKCLGELLTTVDPEPSVDRGNGNTHRRSVPWLNKTAQAACLHMSSMCIKIHFQKSAANAMYIRLTELACCLT